MEQHVSSPRPYVEAGEAGIQSSITRFATATLVWLLRTEHRGARLSWCAVLASGPQRWIWLHGLRQTTDYFSVLFLGEGPKRFATHVAL